MGGRRAEVFSLPAVGRGGISIPLSLWQKE